MFRIDSAKIEAGGCNTKGNSIPIDDMYIGYVKKKRFESGFAQLKKSRRNSKRSITKHNLSGD